MHVQGKDVIDVGLFRHYMINSILSTKATHGKKFGEIVIAIDGRNYWRKGVFPHYKAHRKAHREKSTIDYDAFYAAVNQVKHELKTVFPYKVIEVEGAEADDVIGVLASIAQEPTLIYANDGDFEQLLRNPACKQYRTITKKWIADKPLPEIEWDLFYKICKGDAGDGIPSCINPNDCFVTKTRQKPLSEKTIRDWYSNGIPPNVSERFFENKRLIDLREVPAEIKESILAEFSKEPVGSKGLIYKYLMENDLRQLAQSLMDDLGRI